VFSHLVVEESWRKHGIRIVDDVNVIPERGSCRENDELFSDAPCGSAEAAERTAGDWGTILLI
jgi:hypothetical protein